MIHDRYFYQVASAAQKERMKLFYQGLENFQEKIRIPGVLTEKEIMEVVEGVRSDNPALFHFGHKVSYAVDPVFGETWIIPSYICTREEARDYAPRIRQRMKIMYQGLKLGRPGLSDYDKVLKVHDAMVRLFTYDHDSLSLGVDTDKFHAAHSILGVFGRRTAVCEGISLAIKLILNMADIPCIAVGGHAGTEGPRDEVNHAWNIVRIDGVPYQMDVTWDINQSDEGKYLSYAYFLLTDREMGLTHSCWDARVPCTATSQNYFVKNGLVFRSEREVARFLSKNFIAGEKRMTFRIGWHMRDLERTLPAMMGRCIPYGAACSYSIDSPLQIVSVLFS